MAVNTRIQLKRDTTENWNNKRDFIPYKGEVIIYTDWKPRYAVGVDGCYILDSGGNKIRVYNQDNEPQFIPGIKIGDGKAYLCDLPFTDEELRAKLISHIEDTEVHVLLGERPFWNNKIDVIDENTGYNNQSYINNDNSLISETLVLTRDPWKENFRKY